MKIEMPVGLAPNGRDSREVYTTIYRTTVRSVSGCDDVIETGTGGGGRWEGFGEVEGMRNGEPEWL